MATTSNTITATAGQIEFPFSFPYLKKESIKVTIDTVATTAFTIPDNNPTTVVLNSGATAGQVIVISRLTSTTATPSTFFSGGAIRSQDLNNNFDSILYITQEKENQLTEVIAGGIADGSITSSKLANQSVGTAALIDGGVATVDLADNAVTTPKIVNNAVTTDKIINDAVTTAKILDANVTPAKLSTGGPGWTSSGALGLNGANYGTQYQIAQSNGNGAASTWVNRSKKDTEVNIVSSPAAAFKNIAFDTAALAWASKIDIYFRDVSSNVSASSLSIKLLDQTNNTFSAGTLIGFGFTTQYYNTPNFINEVPRVWAQDNGIYMPWGVPSSTRTGRLTLFNAQSTVWMVDFQAVASTNPVFPQQFQSSFTGNGYQVQPASGTGQLGGVQFIFDGGGQIDSGAVAIHYS